MKLKAPTPAQISLGVTGLAILGVLAMPTLTGLSSSSSSSKTERFTRSCTNDGVLADCNIVLKSDEATEEQKNRKQWLLQRLPV